MNTKLLESAMHKIPSPELLINIVSRRVRQLSSGHRPLIVVDGRMDPQDIALKEIVEGKLSYELIPADDEQGGEPARV